MKNIILLLLLLPGVNNAFSQSKLPPLSVGKIANINNYLMRFYRPDTAFTNHACINTVVFVKFSVINEKIDSLSFSPDCPIQIKEPLKKALLATSRYFKSTDNEKALMRGKTYLLPVIFYYQLGCSSSQIVQKESQTAKEPMAELMKYASRDEPIRKSLGNLLKFDDGKSYSSLNCVLISPIIFSTYD